jgi:hypothetical protein
VKRSGSETTHYVFEGDEPIFEKKVSSGKIRSYIYALGKHLARVDGAIGGTVRRFIKAIREKGLLPQSRQYVHLSVDIVTAIQVGKSRDDIKIHDPITPPYIIGQNIPELAWDRCT